MKQESPPSKTAKAKANPKGRVNPLRKLDVLRLFREVEATCAESSVSGRRLARITGHVERQIPGDNILENYCLERVLKGVAGSPWRYFITIHGHDYIRKMEAREKQREEMGLVA